MTSSEKKWRIYNEDNEEIGMITKRNKCSCKFQYITNATILEMDENECANYTNSIEYRDGEYIMIMKKWRIYNEDNEEIGMITKRNKRHYIEIYNYILRGSSFNLEKFPYITNATILEMDENECARDSSMEAIDDGCTKGHVNRNRSEHQ